MQRALDGTERTYEFSYFGDHMETVLTAASAWCSRNECTIELVRLLEGGRFRLCGPEPAIRAAFRAVREWIQAGVAAQPGGR